MHIGVIMEDSAVPQVSVIIPLYNKASYIKRALDSVLAQTVQDFEIVVVGGCSTDGGEDIVLGYSDPRIRFVKEAGKGVSAARNQGVDAARAELVAFLDADDEWPSNFLSAIFNLRNDYPTAGIYSTGYMVNHPGGCIIRKYKTLDNNYFGIMTSYFKSYAIEGPMIATSSVVIPKSIIRDVGMFNIHHTYHEDTELFGKIAIQYPIAINTKIRTIYYNGDAASLSKKRPKEFIDPMIPIINNLSQNDEMYANYNDIMLYCDRLKLDSARFALLANNHELFSNLMSQLVFRDYFKSYIFILRVVNMMSPSCIRNMKFFQKIVGFILSATQQRYFSYIYLKDIMNKQL